MEAEPALIALHDVSRIYRSGEGELRALDRVNLRIQRGEYVAIMGQSGSGKSTLMNILGCLDRPTHGHYQVNGHDVGQLDEDQLSALRLRTFGFVFQRYHLLGNYTAKENVALPAIYRHAHENERLLQAEDLLTRLGLGERGEHRPAELSGGQQQRVSVARALINGAEVILADEPTGALDSNSGQQMLELLSELNAQGTTVVLITHDATVASRAKRLVNISDGKIISDDGAHTMQSSAELASQQDSSAGKHGNAKSEIPQIPPKEAIATFPNISLLESINTALVSLEANVFRTFLTLLGIIIGVASVVLMMAIGEGGKQQVLDRIEAMGSNLLLVFPGGANLRSSGDVATLTLADAQAIRQLPSVEAVAPMRTGRATIRAGANDYSGRIRGSTPDYVQVRNWPMARGIFFTAEDMQQLASVMVIGQTVAQQLFPDGRNPVGEYVFMKNSLYQIIGVLAVKGASPSGSDMDDNVLIPLSTAKVCLFGRNHLSSIALKVAQGQDPKIVEQEISALLFQRHGRADTMVRSTDAISNTLTQTQDTLTWLLASVAAISLVVGGIGVMNIMLVSVSERRREIGLRIATGAKPSDILRQFNIEALVVCCMGGILGVIIGILGVWAMAALSIAVSLTVAPALLAFLSALLVGLVFGHAPARQAAKLDPIKALAEE